MPTPIKLKQGTNYYQPLCYFPIGYIYLSTSKVNPGQFFGGTWEPIKDRFLLLAGDTYKGGQTGGEATHKLTTNEMPSHSHGAGKYDGQWMNNGAMSFGAGTQAVIINNENHGYRIVTSNTGGNQAHENMPPYIVVYGWVKVSN